MADEWFFAVNDTERGPVSAAQLKALADIGELSPNDYVWKSGMRDWVEAAHVKGLFPNSPIPSSAHNNSRPASSNPNPTGKFCHACGKSLHPLAEMCPSCGVRQDVSRGRARPGTINSRMIVPSKRPHDPILIAILSGCCITGLGQIVIGQIVKGLAMLAGSIVLACLTWGISLFATWPAIAIDAYLVARKLKDGYPVSEWESFPS